MHTILSSATKTVRIGDDQPFAIIGERINPTGRKIFQLQLRNGDLSRVEIDVKEQVDGGAMLLDVNMGAPLADEAALMTRAVTLIQELTDLPLVIDSSIVEVLEAGLAAYQGKALVKSGLRDQVIVMVGGAPVTQEYADAAGADGYASDASAAVARARELLAQRRALPAGGDGPPKPPVGINA